MQTTCFPGRLPPVKPDRAGMSPAYRSLRICAGKTMRPVPIIRPRRWEELISTADRSPSRHLLPEQGIFVRHRRCSADCGALRMHNLTLFVMPQFHLWEEFAFLDVLLVWKFACFQLCKLFCNFHMSIL